jgi:hypothetical protein
MKCAAAEAQWPAEAAALRQPPGRSSGRFREITAAS